MPANAPVQPINLAKLLAGQQLPALPQSALAVMEVAGACASTSVGERITGSVMGEERPMGEGGGGAGAAGSRPHATAQPRNTTNAADLIAPMIATTRCAVPHTSPSGTVAAAWAPW